MTPNKMRVWTVLLVCDSLLILILAIALWMGAAGKKPQQLAFPVGGADETRIVALAKATNINMQEIKQTYAAYRAMPHKPNGISANACARFATPDDKVIRALAIRICGDEKWPAERMSRIVRFVQTLQYQPDPLNEEYVKRPIETLLEGGGDCEDLSLLAGSLLSADGHDCVLLIAKVRDANFAHAFLGVSGVTGLHMESPQAVFDGKSYLMVETTAAEPLGSFSAFNLLDFSWSSADHIRSAAQKHK